MYQFLATVQNLIRVRCEFCNMYRTWKHLSARNHWRKGGAQVLGKPIALLVATVVLINV